MILLKRKILKNMQDIKPINRLKVVLVEQNRTGKWLAEIIGKNEATVSRWCYLYGSEFELKLRNELSQKAIAKECAEWIRQKVTFKSNVTQNSMHGFIHVSNTEDRVYTPVSGFTTTDIGCDRGNSLCNIVNRLSAPHSNHYLKTFNELWNDKSKMQDVTNELSMSRVKYHDVDSYQSLLNIMQGV